MVLRSWKDARGRFRWLIWWSCKYMSLVTGHLLDCRPVEIPFHSCRKCLRSWGFARPPAACSCRLWIRRRKLLLQRHQWHLLLRLQRLAQSGNRLQRFYCLLASWNFRHSDQVESLTPGLFCLAKLAQSYCWELQWCLSQRLQGNVSFTGVRAYDTGLDAEAAIVPLLLFMLQMRGCRTWNRLACVFRGLFLWSSCSRFFFLFLWLFVAPRTIEIVSLINRSSRSRPWSIQ